MKITLPEDVLYIIHTLQEAGWPAYAVGGCVRDCLRGREPADWDIATAALPEQTAALFPRTVPTGIRHGTVTVLAGKNAYEVTTLRVDGVYEDHRRPEQVHFTADIVQDLSRRDFTMNAMAYHPDTGLIDPFDGRGDIARGLIRCVGDPLVRFDEDALRMLRAVRFAAQTGFVVSEDIIRAMTARAELICAVSAERIRDELMKILLSDRPQALERLREAGLLALILPELDRCFSVAQHSKYHCYDVGHHIMEVVRHVPPEPALRLAALLHDIGKPDKKTTDPDGTDHFKGHEAVSAALAEQILTRLRLDNRTKEEVLQLIRFHDRRMAETKASVRRAISAVGADMFPRLLCLMRADAMGQHPDRLADSLRHYEAVEALRSEIMAEGDALQLSDLAIDGRDLLELGYRGPAIGAALSRALDFVLEHPEQNEKALLLSGIKNKLF